MGTALIKKLSCGESTISYRDVGVRIVPDPRTIPTVSSPNGFSDEFSFFYLTTDTSSSQCEVTILVMSEMHGEGETVAVVRIPGLRVSSFTFLTLRLSGIIILITFF